MIVLGILLLGLLQLSTAQDYMKALTNSIMFYEVQRSGQLPSNNRIPWRGDSALGDGSDNGLDLTGGWYDAGDHVKFGFTMASSVTILAWGVYAFRDSYVQAGQLDIVLDSLKWPLDYFIKCHVRDNQLYGQVGDGHVDHAYWGRPEQMTMFRPSFSIAEGNPGSDLAGETSAAMAAGSLIFREMDPAYADTLLDHAIRLNNFAYNYRGIYSDSIPADDFYRSSGFEDEIAWSSIWLYIATGEQMYLDRALEFYTSWARWAFSWDDKMTGVQVLMYQATGDQQYADHVDAFLSSWYPGGGITYTPKGLAWRAQWGPLRYSANSAAIALLAANAGIGNVQEKRDWAKGQIDYMLNNFFVVAYDDNNFPRRPHHCSASCHPDHSVPCDWDDFNTPDYNDNVLTGALVGGPNQTDYWEDNRADYVMNEVSCDYNAGFQTALAGLLSF